MAEHTSLEVRCSPHFVAWLHDAGLSLAFTTYQTNRLFLVGHKLDGSLSVFERHFDWPMGLYATPEQLHLATRFQLWRLENALPEGQTHEGHDRVYVPRHAHTTGALDIHDVAVDGAGRVIFANTAYSCLATLSERYSFAPLWHPSFISDVAYGDRCHLNGLGLVNGRPAYVTAVSRSDVAEGWRAQRRDGGCVVAVPRGETVVDGLSMPHSPRVHAGRLWVLNSGSGELGYVDRERGRLEPVAFCPGFLRGLAFVGDYAVVGLSRARENRTFEGLALDEHLRQRGTDARCGLWIVDLRSGEVPHWLELVGVVRELYDVQILEGVRRPMAVGFRTDEIQRLITIDTAPRPVFQALSRKPPDTPASERRDS